jgi:hypothetical protein
MRLAATAIAAFLLLIATPSNAPAPAQDLGRVLGPLKSVLRGAIRVRPYSYRSRARYARRPGASRAAIAQERASQAAQARGAQMAQLGQLAQPEAFWPGASQDVFDYVLTPREDGLWAHGFGAVVVSMFTPPPKKDAVASGEPPAQPAQAEQPQSEQAATPQQTEGAATPNGTASRSAAQSAEGSVCGEDRASHAEAVTDWIRDTLSLAGDQRVVTQLRAALTQADNEITAGCPREIPSALPDRLRAMQDRLWALRVAATNLRAPLQDFDKGLTKEQKAKLDPPPQLQAGRDSQSRRRAQAAQAAQAEMAGKLCYAQAQRAPQWPAEQIARAVRPNKEQQERLAALSETSSKMSMMMMGVCPQKPAATPQDRLNVALDWLDNSLLAAANVAVAVDDFYGSLSDEQKSKLDALSL